MNDTYYNLPSVKQSQLDREVAETDVVTFLLPQSYFVAAIYAISGVYLANKFPKGLFGSLGYLLQIGSAAIVLRKLAAKFTNDPTAGKGF